MEQSRVMARISVGRLALFPQQDDERAAHQEHKPHAVHPGPLFGEVVSAAADERAFIAGRWQFDGDKLNTLHHLGAGTFVASGKMVKALD